MTPTLSEYFGSIVATVAILERTRMTEELNRDADRVIAEMTKQFGPGFTNGVAAILLHDSLPDNFDKSNWSEWFFKPSDAAFEWALDQGLIGPWKLSGKWGFTQLGKRAAEIVRAAVGEGTKPLEDRFFA
jgi:hypothetical protein